MMLQKYQQKLNVAAFLQKKFAKYDSSA